MPIAAATLASVALASSLAAAAPAAASLPPIVVDVTVAPNVPATLVSRVLDEADAVWRPSGLTFVWRRACPDGVSFARALVCPPSHQNLDVVIGTDPIALSRKLRDNQIPLGRIVFDEPDVPDRQIYLSYGNAVEYMGSAREVVGPLERMTLVEREILLARVLGRALAHEIGHYLLASKAHTPGGLMQAVHTANEFFGYSRDSFRIDAAQRRTLEARLGRELVASR
jgi:hypothetical protein